MANFSLAQAISGYNNNPPSVQNMWAIDIPVEGLSDIQIYAKGFSFPGRTINFEPVNYRGYGIPIPTNLSMTQEHTMTVISDVNGNLRTAFLGWLNKTVDPTTMASDRRPTVGNGCVTMTVALLNANFSAVKTFKIYGCRCGSVGELEMSNDSASIATFSVTLHSVYWE